MTAAAKRLTLIVMAAGALGSAAATIDLVSAKGVEATAWVELEMPGAGEMTAAVRAPDGFAVQLLREVKEPCDPNAFFTDVPGIGEKVPVGVGLAEATKATVVAADERVRFRVVIPVGESAPEGVHRGKVLLTCGGRSVEHDLTLRVLDFVLPPAKSRYSGRNWLLRTEGGLPKDWTVESADTYAKHAAEVSSVAASMRGFASDLAAERWRAFGVGYYGIMDFPIVANPDVWRRQAGIWAWQRAYDGVVLPKDIALTPVQRAGLEDALVDVRYVSYASELANALADKSKRTSKVVYEGRMGQFWCDRIDPSGDDMDVVRLETQARLVRLLAFARKEVSK